MKTGNGISHARVLIRQALVACGCMVIFGLHWVAMNTAAAQAPATQEEPKVTFDLRTLDSHFPFAVPQDVEAWKLRSEAVRFHLQMSLGLWPMPDKHPLKPVEHGAIDCGEYTVSRVYFESFPGFFVTGSLYRPKNLAAPGPGK